MSSAKTILWLTWKDLSHPQAGGAEVLNEALAARLANKGHKVIFVVAGFRGAKSKVLRDGFEIRRLGNRYTLYWKAYRYYKRNKKIKYDLVIDEMNTLPFFAKMYSKQPVILMAYMLCRKIWFYQLPRLVGAVGYVIEPLYLRYLSDSTVVTISNSTKDDLVNYGFDPKNIGIISVGVQMDPISSPEDVSKYEQTTILSFGNVRPMKQTHDQVKAFNIAKKQIPGLKMIIAGGGGGKYHKELLDMVNNGQHGSDISYLGKVSDKKKLELFQKSHILLVTSVKEGWGLIVTEAASQGTPAAVYDVEGLRDSVRDKDTGIVTDTNPQALAEGIIRLVEDEKYYERLRNNAWRWSHEITFDRAANQFEKIMLRNS